MLEWLDFAIQIILIPYGFGSAVVATRVIRQEIEAVRNGQKPESFESAIVEVYGWPADLWLRWREK